MIFPPQCGGCGKLGERWCADCRQALTPIQVPVCDICGEPQPKPGICGDCKASRPAFFALRSCAVFKEPLRPALHRLKYRGDISLGEALGWSLALYLDSLGWQADAVIPIPLSRQRMQERGYNQAGLIARPLSLIMRWSYYPNILIRARHTRSQVGLNAEERRRNTHGAFTIQSRLVEGKTILLVDDVATTGATLNSASQALATAGAVRVYALTMAKALQKYGLDHVEHSSVHPLR